MGRTMPAECEHGNTLDWGDFGNEWDPYHGVCPICVPVPKRVQLTDEYRLMNRHWLEEFHAHWYAAHDTEAAVEQECDPPIV